MDIEVKIYGTFQFNSHVCIPAVTKRGSEVEEGIPEGGATDLRSGGQREN